MITSPDSKPIFDKNLIEKYDRAGPRYTSYPTVVQFTEQFTVADYLEQITINNQLPTPHPLSLYFHIPFCQMLCYYCACNKIITKRKEKAVEYMHHLEREIAMQAQLFKDDRAVSQLHLGGGTPTFLSLQQIDNLLQSTAQFFNYADSAQRDFSIEIDPRTICYDYLVGLRQIGFNRLSFGVQDFNPAVQKAIHRIQPQEQVTELFNHAKSLGFKSINIDLIYGLPLQTIDSMAITIKQIISLKPDRLSLFNYAHLPDRFTPQKRINSEDLPTTDQKLQILKNTIDALDNAGYVYIGMDHFALPDDTLAKACLNGTLRRNFQGYSSHRHTDLIAMGVSSISHIGGRYAQNFKTLEPYYQSLDKGKLPIHKGYIMNPDDWARQFVIMQLMCYKSLDYVDFDNHFKISFTDYFASELKQLKHMQRDGLLRLTSEGINIQPVGRLLLRNIVMVFDAYLNNHTQTKKFSRTI